MEAAAATRTGREWRNLLDRCASQEDVVATARDFVASFDPAAIALLSPSCKPGRIKYPDDVTFYAFDLAHNDLQSDGGNTVNELRVFFSHASARICYLATVKPTLTQKVLRLFA